MTSNPHTLATFLLETESNAVDNVLEYLEILKRCREEYAEDEKWVAHYNAEIEKTKEVLKLLIDV